MVELDQLRLKFRQSKDYTREMLIRDLIELAEEINARFGAQSDAIDTNAAGIAANLAAIAVNAANIAANAALIAANTAAIGVNSDSIAANAAAIAVNAVDIDSLEADVLTLESSVATNTADITALEADFAGIEESGTWTPTLEFDGLSVGVTYTTRTGTYLKRGRLVFVKFIVVLSSKGTSVGGARIRGLPFTPTDYAALSIASVSAMALSASTLLGGFITSADEVRLLGYGNTGAYGLDNNNLTNTSAIYASATYVEA